MLLVVLEKALESPGDSKEIKPIYPKGNQSQIFIGRTDAEALILWPPDEKSWLIGKDSDSGKDWGQEKRAIENEMVGWHHWLNGHEFEQTLGDSEGQGSLVCCNSWGWKSQTWLSNWTTTTQPYTKWSVFLFVCFVLFFFVVWFFCLVFLSHKRNKIVPFSEMWMGLETVIRVK